RTCRGSSIANWEIRGASLSSHWAIIPGANEVCSSLLAQALARRRPHLLQPEPKSHLGRGNRMFLAPKGPVLFALSIVLAGVAAFQQVPQSPAPPAAQTTPEQTTPAEPKGVRSAEIPDVPDEVPEEELAPAALELDVSKESPLLQLLYKATRETK